MQFRDFGGAEIAAFYCNQDSILVCFKLGKIASVYVYHVLFPPIRRLVRLVGNNVRKAFWVVCCICPYIAMRMRDVQDSVLKEMTKFQDMF